MKKILLNNKINCLTNFFDNMRNIIVYCHGYGENKESIDQHKDILDINNIGFISFDFPSHGDDTTNYQDITYDMCYEYIDTVVKYIKEKYPNVKISLVGASFGGYMALNYINDSKMQFHRVYLKYPAINFYECIKRKLNIDDTYFDNHNYFELPSGYRLYKKFYFDCKQHDITKNFNKNNNYINIVHGDQDKTVLVDDVSNFINKFDLKLNIVVGEVHGMPKHIDYISEEIVNFLN